MFKKIYVFGNTISLETTDEVEKLHFRTREETEKAYDEIVRDLDE